MKIYDISLEIKENMVVWNGSQDKKPKFRITAEYDKRGVNESRIDMDLHTGTHADAPFHMLKSGKKLNQIPLDKFIGRCELLNLKSIRMI